MGLTVEQIILAATVLIREAIESQNYVPGVSGWALFANGNLEVNSGTFRGVVDVGTPPTTVEISDVLPPELLAYYVPSLFDSIGTAFIKLNDADGSYTYMLAGSNSAADYSAWAIGQVSEAGTVQQQLLGQYFPGTDVTQLNIGDPDLDFRTLLFGFAGFEGPAEFDDDVSHFGDVFIDNGRLIMQQTVTATALTASLETDANDRFELDTSGAMAWGTGAAATDTSLSRTGVAALTTPGSLNIGVNNNVTGAHKSGNDVYLTPTITPVANTLTSLTVTYTALKGTGAVTAFATVNTSVYGTTITAGTASGATTTSTLIWILRSNTTATGYYLHVHREL